VRVPDVGMVAEGAELVELEAVMGEPSVLVLLEVVRQC
jgi:hypothetical protein